MFQPKVRADEQPDIYDPAFYLPMFVSMFASSEIVYSYRTCQSGCFSLILSALSSHHKDVRTTAFVTLQRFHCHLLRFESYSKLIKLNTAKRYTPKCCGAATISLKLHLLLIEIVFIADMQYCRSKLYV